LFSVVFVGLVDWTSGFSPSTSLKLGPFGTVAGITIGTPSFLPRKISTTDLDHDPQDMSSPNPGQTTLLQPPPKTQLRRSNIYQNYLSSGKPILLIGHSSSSNEVSRLGKAAMDALTTPGQSTGKVVSLAEWASSIVEARSSVEGKSEIDWSQLVGEKLASVMALKGSDAEVWLLDRSSTFWDSHDGAFEIIANALYTNHNILSLYVNVKDDSRAISTINYRSYSDYELCCSHDEESQLDDDDWEHLEWEVSRILARALLPPAVPGSPEPTVNTAALTMGQHTFFLSLTFPKVQDVGQYIQEICTDVDALEYRTDLLESVVSWNALGNDFNSDDGKKLENVYFDVLFGMQQLRKLCRPHVQRVPALPLYGSVIEDVMPLVYTVRTCNQAGKVSTRSFFDPKDALPLL
jgi:hypothetical protein